MIRILSDFFKGCTSRKKIKTFPKQTKTIAKKFLNYPQWNMAWKEMNCSQLKANSVPMPLPSPPSVLTSEHCCHQVKHKTQSAEKEVFYDDREREKKLIGLI